MSHARRSLSLRDADTAALDYARRLHAGLNGLRLEGEGEGGGDGGGGEGGGSSGSGEGSGEGGAAGEGGSGGEGAGEEGGSGKSTGKGYPENTPVVEMTPEQQAAYWKAQSRKHEQRASQRSDYDDVKAKAEQFDELQRSKQSDEERIREEAREAGRKEAARDNALKLVDARIEAAAAGRIGEEQLASAIEFLDRSRFLDDDNEVDADKVVEFVGSITPATGNGSGKGRELPDLGQGRRKGGSKTSVASGRDLYQERHGSKKS